MKGLIIKTRYTPLTRRGKKELTLKLYDATANAIQKKMTVKPSGHWLKYEMKLHKPHKNFGQVVTVSDIINDKSIIDKAYSEMGHHYGNINKGVAVSLPTNPSTEDLILAGLIKANPDPISTIEQLIKESDLNTQGSSKRRGFIKDKLNQVTIEESKYILDL